MLGEGGMATVPYLMPIPLFKLARQAKNLPEVAIVLRVLVGIAGVFVLFPVVSNLRDPGSLSVTDYIGLVVFVGVGVWLLRFAIRGRE